MHAKNTLRDRWTLWPVRSSYVPMARLKGDPIPKGYVAQGTSGVAVGVGDNAKALLKAETARCRAVWNQFLALQIDTYPITGQFVFYLEMARQLTYLRKTNPWIGQGGLAAQQTTLRNLDRALRESFPKSGYRRGFPRFKRASAQRDRLSVPAARLRICRQDDKVTHVGFPNLPLLRVRNLTVPKGARITWGYLSMRAGRWQVSLSIITPIQMAPHPVVAGLGVDMGLTTLAVAASSDGKTVITVENPRPLKKNLKVLKRRNRTHSRRAAGSVNRRRAAVAIAKTHRRIGNLRRAHQHRATRAIIDMAAHVTVEKLALKAMRRTRASQSFADAGLGSFIGRLRYKAAWAGRGFTQISRFTRSTGCCPDCRIVGDKIPWPMRKWTCMSCGETHDRDIASARWLDMVGRQSPEPVLDTPGPKRGSADGVEVGSLRSTRLPRVTYECVATEGGHSASASGASS
jgi:putative transposase